MFRLLSAALSIALAALAGNWVGSRLRARKTGQPFNPLRFRYTSPEGETFSSAPMLTNFIPALLCASLGKPRWFYAFLGGVLVSRWIGDRYELQWLKWTGKRLSGKQEPA